MKTIYVKIIFLIYTTIIFIYISSYSKYEITKNNNIFGGIFVFIFSLISIILSNIMFFLK